ncbi:hypothetical protein ACVWZ3_006417 [Bradyrhizobium sp. i1.3.6]
MLPRRWPTATKSPALTRRFENVPSDRRAHRGEGEIALGLGERGLELGELRLRFGLLRLGDVDIADRDVVGGLGGLDRGGALVASGFRAFERGARSKALAAQRLLALIIEIGALEARLGRDELRLGLCNLAVERCNLAADAIDGGLLGRDPGRGGIDRDLVVAVIDAEDDVAGAHGRVVAGEDRRDVAGNARAQHGVVGADIGVVGGDVEAADQRVVAGIAPGRERQHEANTHQDEFALAGLRRVGGSGCSRLVGHGRLRRLIGAALGFLGHMRAQLLGKGDGFLGRSFTAGLPRRRLHRFLAKDTRSLVSRYGHKGLPNKKAATRDGRPAAGSLSPIPNIIDRTVRST